jgi:hypothetical protein
MKHSPCRIWIGFLVLIVTTGIHPLATVTKAHLEKIQTEKRANHRDDDRLLNAGLSIATSIAATNPQHWRHLGMEFVLHHRE